MDGHLVTIEIGVIGFTYQRMQTDCFTFDKYRFKRLDTQTVKRRCAVQQYRMFSDDIFQYIPDIIVHTVDFAFCIFDVACDITGNQFFHQERFEQLDRHFFRQAALVHFQERSNYDYGTSGVVNTFTQQVLTETSLLPFQHVRK